MSQNAIDWVQRSYARRGRSGDGRRRDASASGGGGRPGPTPPASSPSPRLDATTTNVLAVDTNAVYWGGTYAALPGTRIGSRGSTRTRYISWNVYDAAARPIDALSDVQLAPIPAARTRSCPAPTAPSRALVHRLHRGRPEAGPAGAEHALRATRAAGPSSTGIRPRCRPRPEGRPLPRVTLEQADGERHALTVDQCRELQAPYAQPLNDLIAGAPGCPTPRTTATAIPAAIRRIGGSSRTSARRRSTSCSTTRTARRSATTRRPAAETAPGSSRTATSRTCSRRRRAGSATCSSSAGERRPSPTPAPAGRSCRAASSFATGRSASTSLRRSG